MKSRITIRRGQRSKNRLTVFLLGGGPRAAWPAPERARRCATSARLVLLDMNVAGEDGIALVNRHERLVQVPVLALTAHAMRGDRERSWRGGCGGCLAQSRSRCARS